MVATPSEERAPWLSPDARWLAYVSDDSGRDEVYVKRCGRCLGEEVAADEQRKRISTNGGTAPVWSSDGSELFYVEGQKMMSVAIRADPDFDQISPELLFEAAFVLDQWGNPNYDVAPDGERFVMIRDSETNPGQGHRINIVLNWFEELKRLVPTGGR